MVTVKKGKGVGISIQTGEIDDGAVTTAKLAATAVTEAKLGALAVTTAKLAADAITEAKVADNAIQKEHFNATGIAANQVLKVNSDNTALIWDTGATTAEDNITIGSTTKTLKEWLFAL